MDVHIYSVHHENQLKTLVKLFWIHIGRMPIKAQRKHLFKAESDTVKGKKTYGRWKKNNLGVFASRLKCKSGEIQKIAVQWD